jgi:HNH endonuclease
VPNSTRYRWIINAAFASDAEVECEYCERRVFRDLDPNAPAFATVEHRIPLSRGGLDVRDNVSIACRRCNSEKGSLTYDEFMSVRDDPVARKNLQTVVMGLVSTIQSDQMKRTYITRYGASRHCVLCRGSGIWPEVSACPCTR